MPPFITLIECSYWLCK